MRIHILVVLSAVVAAPQHALFAQAAQQHRSIAIDSRLADDAGLHVGDVVVIAAEPDAPGDTVRVGAITRPSADPSEIARREYRVRMHLDQLQTLTSSGDRVHRFAVATNGPAAEERAVAEINAAAFGFRAHRSRDVAVETSATFAVVSRFHRAIGVITIAASAIFLLCILLLKVDERRRDVAALRLMGISRATVVKSVVIEAAAVAVLGSILGAGLGLLAALLVNMHYQGVYRTPLLFAVVTPQVLTFALALSLVLGAAAGALAALRLARTHPLVLLGRR
jgi:ABC-type lipoprotein release transport system permease subunit